MMARAGGHVRSLLCTIVAWKRHLECGFYGFMIRVENAKSVFGFRNADLDFLEIAHPHIFALPLLSAVE